MRTERGSGVVKGVVFIDAAYHTSCLWVGDTRDDCSKLFAEFLSYFIMVRNRVVLERNGLVWRFVSFLPR